MKDWTEDFTHENGMYQNRCRTCNELFLGHKRRLICKECPTQELVNVDQRVMPKAVEELLPCPFCGGEAGIGTTRISDPMTAKLNGRTNGFFVNCKICGANNNSLRLGYATKEIARHYWNTRK